ncbi:MAG: diguanylate cyclase [Rhodobacteraceae bacterium]|jgi:two-component system cell cycle response regulator|nr:diguanylate cyclase [Paracoccaceae bacterium]
MPGNTIVVDPVAGNRILLCAALGEVLDDAHHAATGAEALAAFGRDPPALVLIHGRPADMSSGDLTRRIKQLAPGTPVLILAAAGSGGEVIEGLLAGADAVLRRPVEQGLLLAQLRALKRQAAMRDEWQARSDTARDLGFSEPVSPWTVHTRISVVATSPDDPDARTWCDALTDAAVGHATVVTRDTALTGPPSDAYVLHADSGGAHRGLELLAELRARAVTRNACVVVVLRPGDRAGAITALDTGASDIMTDRAEAGELALRVATQIARKTEADKLRRSVEAGLRMAAVDALTGLWNRRYALPHIERLAQRADATGQTWAVAIFDIDRFKQVNDRHGHAAGDRVLAEVADRLRLNTRSVDLVARLGGEEFLVVLPEGNLAVARQVAERIRQRVAEHPVSLPGLPPVAVTVSAGIALGVPGVAVETVLARADRALMRSKTGGRNQVRVARTAA